VRAPAGGGGGGAGTGAGGGGPGLRPWGEYRQPVNIMVPGAEV